MLVALHATLLSESLTCWVFINNVKNYTCRIVLQKESKTQTAMQASAAACCALQGSCQHYNDTVHWRRQLNAPGCAMDQSALQLECAEQDCTCSCTALSVALHCTCTVQCTKKQCTNSSVLCTNSPKSSGGSMTFVAVPCLSCLSNCLEYSYIFVNSHDICKFCLCVLVAELVNYQITATQ